MKFFNFNDEIHFQGKWWLPESPKKNVSGILDFNQSNNHYLVLDSTFSKHDINSNFNKYPLIHGTTTDGNICSLINACECQINNNWNMNKTEKSSKLFFNKLFIGNRSFNPENELIESVELKLKNFDKKI